ncbi:MAG: hypothetical protein J6Q54_07675, partial [Oscillospiraceae bacterium]|nr:hypothetical protein [Oscillospiraceae bacterium]
MLMKIPYRTRQSLKRWGIALLVLLLVAVAVGICWFVWLERYLVYTKDQGAILDFSLSQEVADGNPPEELPEETVSIYYNEGENAINVSKDLFQLLGYYADAEALKDMDMVNTQAKLLAADTPVMLDVKDAKGRFFYSSNVSNERSKTIDIEAMDKLIQTLDSKGVYLIARLPALRDYHFGLTKTENGLFVSSGGYLWADDDYCYWLDPTKEGTIMYLVQIVNELKSLGFDEVVFDNYCFPDTTDLKFSGDRGEALTEAAKTLLSSCASETFAVSFVGGADGFTIPEGRSRMYITGVTAAEAAGIAGASGVADTAINLVFLTEYHDTRFN